MLGLVLLASVAACAQGSAPPYVQSRESFTHMRTYVSEFLAPQEGDFNNPDARTHYGFGILAGVTAALVNANKTIPSLMIVHEHLPYAWRNYNQISEQGIAIMNEVSAKISLMEDLINNLCDAESIEQCNSIVHAKVKSNPNAYKLPAELLLLLGTASKHIRRLESKINFVSKERHEIPYLLKNVDTPDFKTLVSELENAYNKMRQLQFRRYLGYMPYDII